MKITSVLSINFKKLRKRFSQALFLILPITLLVGVSIIATSQVKNVQEALDANIFNEIEDENTILSINYQPEMGVPGAFEDEAYSELDSQQINLIDGVNGVSLLYDIPITSAYLDGLFDEEIILPIVVALDEGVATSFTEENFAYVEGEPIPVILNANTFVTTYEDWQGQDTYEIDFRSLRENGGDPKLASPLKAAAISYDKDSLIGESVTIAVGGFSDITTFNVERDNGTMQFVKKNTDDIVAEEAERKDVVSDYWDYDLLNTGVSYDAIVVGIVESDTDFNTYVPVEFANVLMEEYVSLQNDALKSTPSIDDLGTSFTGLQYDGVELTTSRGLGRGPGAEFVRGIGGGSVESLSYDIPGLILEIDGNTEEVIGLYGEADVFVDSVKTSNDIVVKVDDIYVRAEVVNELNDLGYAYQDLSDLGIFGTVQDNLDAISNGVMIAFVMITVGAIMVAMGKYVSESKKEIGIFRAVGFTKGNILSLFMTQALLYVIVGYALGLALGVVGNFGTSVAIGNWFDGFVTNTVGESFAVVESVDLSMFSNIDWNSVAYLSGTLVIVSLLVSIIPAYQASNVSPVEAIKSE